MYMNPTLEKALDKARTLSTGDQRELASLIVDYTQSVVDGDKFQEDMKDPEYKAFVVGALERGRADIKAGRTHTADQVLRQSKARLKKLHG
ncbi:MAG: hypothetical protein COB20_07095 [SAR86 cluster bacterium]|uniref:Uncharacterized protein n=1 Tax=SAR86 cluster bacterium TaxID=2030880 RepID=A0A2A4X5N2_9GAMM|nr:MAG: hypothetical protein COB20_07095 [SAR86 cluster bacterium]